MSEGEGGIEVSVLENWLGRWKVLEKLDVLHLDIFEYWDIEMFTQVHLKFRRLKARLEIKILELLT